MTSSAGTDVHRTRGRTSAPKLRWWLALLGLLAVACGPSSRGAEITGSHGGLAEGAGAVRAALPGTPEGPSAVAAASAPTGPDEPAAAPRRENGLELRYWIDAARPPTSLVLHILPDGTAELFLGTSPLPVQTDVLGQFRAPVPAELLARIDRHVQDHSLTERSGGETATAEGSGAIAIASGSRSAVLGLATADQDVGELRSLLDQVVAAVARHPFRAVRLALTGRRDGANLVPELALEHVGSEPVSIQLCGLAPPGMCGDAEVVARAGATTIGTSRLDGQALSAEARDGAVPADAFALGPGRPVRLSLPAITVPGNVTSPLQLTARLNLWFAGPGPSRRSAVLEATWPSGAATVATAEPVTAPPAPVRAWLSTDTATTKLGAPVFVTVTIDNASAAPVTICGRLLVNRPTAIESIRDLSFSVEGPPGYQNSVGFAVKAGPCLARDLVTLPPGGRHARRVELSRYESLDLAGDYRLRATFHSARPTDVSRPDVWQGDVQSSAMTIRRQ